MAGEAAPVASPPPPGPQQLPRFTAADVYVGSQIDWGLQFGTIPSRPAFEAYAAGLRERAGYKAAKAIDNALIAEMQAAG